MDHLRREVHPTAPDAWIDDSRTRVGCETPSALFYRPELDGQFELLRNLARLETTRVHPPQSGQALCEWLNSRKDNGQYPSARDLLDTHVPVDLVTDSEVESLLETVQEGRRALRTTMSGILPNVFGSGERDVQGVRNEIRFAAHEAGLIGELVRPLDDPISRAEWSFPHHAAALSRRYRVSTHPAERKDGLLKLGEGLARVLGVLALTELAASNGFSRNLRKQFRTGATFGTWLWILDRLESEGIAPRVQQLATVPTGATHAPSWATSRTSGTPRTTRTASAPATNWRRTSSGWNHTSCGRSVRSAGSLGRSGTGWSGASTSTRARTGSSVSG
jgi:hypothetical protein